MAVSIDWGSLGVLFVGVLMMRALLLAFCNGMFDIDIVVSES